MPLLYETTRKAANLAPSEAREIAAELRAQTSGEVRFDDYDRLMYATDASIFSMTPVGVFLPRSADDVEAAVRIAGAHGVPVTPRGAGTALAGQTANHSIVIDFSKFMNSVVAVSPEERWARMQPGSVNHALSPALPTPGPR